jgi:hypothetical protein
MSIGLFLEKNFKNQEVELLVDHDIEWVLYAEAHKINGMVVHCVFVSYDAECNILTLSSLDDHQLFYICEDFVQMFWRPGFKCTESLKALWSGQKLYKPGKGRDIM